MSLRWGLLLIVPCLLIFILTLFSQWAFVADSLYEQKSFGQIGDTPTLSNYVRIFSDRFYLRVIWVTVKLSAIATILTLLLAYPLAYSIARMRSAWTSVLIAGVTVATFVTIVIKVFGIQIIFAASGWINQTLLGLGLVDRSYTIIGTPEGVVVGLMQFTIGFGVLVLYSVIQTIPRSYESAAMIHGAGIFRTFWRIILPLSLPGLVSSGLMIFNMCMGAFTSAALLGGGRIITLPVLIQRSVMMETKFAFAGALAFTLLILVVLINLISVAILSRMRTGNSRIIA